MTALYNPYSYLHCNQCISEGTQNNCSKCVLTKVKDSEISDQLRLNNEKQSERERGRGRGRGKGGAKNKKTKRKQHKRHKKTRSRLTKYKRDKGINKIYK